MNHAGEIDALVRMVGRIAPSSHVGTAHIEHFDSKPISRAKGEIFNDMANDVVRGWHSYHPADNPHIDLLVELAEAEALQIFAASARMNGGGIRATAYCRQQNLPARNMQLCQRRIGDWKLPSRLARPVRTMSATVWPFGCCSGRRCRSRSRPVAGRSRGASGRGRRHVRDVAGGLAVDR
ncbi:MAG: hypothetical protein CM15mP21_1140 [Hyphomicrobiales bacterium]|nr:MAG: hypothetical protein CM15mP21_1140 [Hyphomicrobiales bacterium]